MQANGQLQVLGTLLLGKEPPLSSQITSEFFENTVKMQTLYLCKYDLQSYTAQEF
jgi:hypothetical protein